MREWNLRAGDPLSLFLAADARMSQPDYTDDQIWELKLSGGNPPAMAVESMLGLRLRGLRIFPVFLMGHDPISDPDRFYSPPTVKKFAPNYLQIRCAPISSMEVECEYWIPDSHSLAGRFSIRNIGAETTTGELWLASVLHSGEDGSPWQMEMSSRMRKPFLKCRAGNLFPVLGLSGEIEAVQLAYTALKTVFSVSAQVTKTITWAFAGLRSWEDGLTRMRTLLETQWEAVAARVELENASMPEIYTGNPDWDAVLAFSQVTAMQAVMHTSQDGPHPAVIVGRAPDRGYSLRGDGSDYPPSWRGASEAEIAHLLPSLAWWRWDLAKNLIRFLVSKYRTLCSQAPKDKNSIVLPSPLIAQTVRGLLLRHPDSNFLNEIFFNICQLNESLYAYRHETGNPGRLRANVRNRRSLRIEMENGDVPMGGEFDFGKVDAPAHTTMWYAECSAMADLCWQQNDSAGEAAWTERKHAMQEALRSMWSGHRYRAIDRRTKCSTQGKRIASVLGSRRKTQRVAIQPPARLLVTCESREAQSTYYIWIAGKNDKGLACKEKIVSSRMRAKDGVARGETENIWAEIESWQVGGANLASHTFVDVLNLQEDDISHFLPLFAHAATAEMEDALWTRLIKLYKTRYGLVFQPKKSVGGRRDAASQSQIWIQWNEWMMQAAIEAKRPKLAWDVLRGIMDTVAQQLKMDNAFRTFYRPNRAGGIGIRNSFLGVVSIYFFMEALGMQLNGNQMVTADPYSIFPFPVEIKNKGQWILRQAKTLKKSGKK
jgi:hypothetical protein